MRLKLHYIHLNFLGAHPHYSNTMLLDTNTWNSRQILLR